MTTTTALDWLPQINTTTPLFPFKPANSSPAAEAEVRLSYKIDAYLFNQQWSAAAHAIERWGEVVLRQGFAHIVRAWIEALPLSLLETSPQLLYLLAICAWRQSQFYVAHRLLARSLRGFEQVRDVAGQGKVLANLAVCAVILGNVKQSKTLTEQALARPLPAWQRMSLLMSRTWFHFVEGHWTEAGQDLAATAWAAQRYTHTAGLRSLTMHLHPTLILLPNGLDHLDIICQQVEQCPPDDEHWRCLAAWQRVVIRWQRGAWAKALLLAQKTLRACEQLRHRSYDVEADLLAIMANIYTAQGRYIEANDYFLRLLNRQPLTDGANPLRLKYLYDLGRKHWLQGNRRSVEQIQQQMAALSATGPLSPQPVLAPLLTGLLALLDQRYEAAEQAICRAMTSESSNNLSPLAVTPGLILAHLYLCQARPEMALAEFRPVLVQCVQENRPSPILQEGWVMIPLLRLAVERGLHASFARRLLKQLGCSSPHFIRHPL